MESTRQKDNANKRTSGFLTLAVLGAMIGLMFVFGFKPPDPPFEGEGLLVDFGTDLTGLGLTEPTSGTPAAPPPSGTQVEQEAITQNTEESIKLPDHKTVDTHKNNTTTTNTHNTNTTTTTTQINKDELFDPSKINTNGNTGSSTEGNTKPGGNMGSPNGDPNGYQGVGSGRGDDGSVGWSLDGRSMKSKPSLSVEHNETGDVRIKIYVDRNGRVTKAEYERSGSTITDTYLINQSKLAALKTTFNVAADAPETQIGYITFHFKLQ